MSEVERHYDHRDRLDSILRSLQEAGADPEHPGVDELGPFDELHLRGREATRELAARLDWQTGLRVLDAGGGLGGSSRYLAATHGCRVTAVDRTASFCAVARELSRRAGLDDRTTFVHGDVTALPVQDASFDVAWTQHAQMNVADKASLYRELSRVLRPGGRLLFHDILGNGNDGLRFPVPWAPRRALSHLAPPDEIRRLLAGAGLRTQAWVDRSDVSLYWLHELVRTRRDAGQEDTAVKFENVARALQGGSLAVVQAVARKDP